MLVNLERLVKINCEVANWRDCVPRGTEAGSVAEGDGGAKGAKGPRILRGLPIRWSWPLNSCPGAQGQLP